MRKRQLVFSDAAIADILEQADWYSVRSGHRLSRRWEKAVNSAVFHILKSPAAGTPCTFSDPALKSVRWAAISEFPKHLLFYRF